MQEMKAIVNISEGVVKIDLLIEQNNETYKLSDLGLSVSDIEESSPSLEVAYRSVTNRSGRTRSNSRFGVKTIRVVGKVYADSLFEYEELKDELNARLVTKEPYYITKMLPVNEEFYDFELPGEDTGDIDLLEMEHEAYKYRYNVILANHSLDFRGRSNRGLLFDFEMNFETDGLPFGESKIRNVTVTNEIPYDGTATNSQLESPWFVRLTATQNQQGDFYFRIGNRTFEHTSLTQIQAGDVFELRGVETRLNDSNINEYTNYEHFELSKEHNQIDTNFVGTIEVIGLKDFYK
jgi:hypothetical protein